jgi:hypothetical protein
LNLLIFFRCRESRQSKESRVRRALAAHRTMFSTKLSTTSVDSSKN